MVARVNFEYLENQKNKMLQYMFIHVSQKENSKVVVKNVVENLNKRGSLF